MAKKNKKYNETSLLLKLMFVCVALSLAMLAIVAYDKIIRKPCDCETKITKDCWEK